MSTTVLVISAAYSRIIEEFPHGGGGYVVATKLLGARAWHASKLPVEVALIAGLTALNLRGVRESVLALAPIFLLFLVTHGLLICARARDRMKGATRHWQCVPVSV